MSTAPLAHSPYQRYSRTQSFPTTADAANARMKTSNASHTRLFDLPNTTQSQARFTTYCQPRSRDISPRGGTFPIQTADPSSIQSSSRSPIHPHTSIFRLPPRSSVHDLKLNRAFGIIPLAADFLRLELPLPSFLPLVTPSIFRPATRRIVKDLNVNRTTGVLSLTAAVPSTRVSPSPFVPSNHRTWQQSHR